jgi:hypothetical protein
MVAIMVTAMGSAQKRTGSRSRPCWASGWACTTACAPEPASKASSTGSRLLAATGSVNVRSPKARLAPRPGRLISALAARVMITPHTATLIRSRKSEFMGMPKANKCRAQSAS